MPLPNEFLQDQVARAEHPENDSKELFSWRIGGLYGFWGIVTALLMQIRDGVGLSGDALTDAELRATPVAVTLPTGAHTLGSTAATGNGTAAAGASAITFLPDASFVGTIDGIAYTGAAFQVIPFQAQPGKTLPAIAYTRSAGTLNIHRLV